MKRTALLLLCAGAAHALDVTVTPAWSSVYLFRGQRLAGSSFQPYVEAAGDGVTAGVWSSFPTDEVDPYASYTWNLGSGLSLQPGATLYTFGSAEDPAARGRRVAFEPSLALNVPVAGIRLSPKVYADLTRRVLTGELNASAALPLRSWGTEVDLGATLGAYSAWEGPDYRSGYWLVQAGVPYQLPDHLRANVTAGYSAAFDPVNVRDRGARAFVSLSLSYTFQ